MSDQLVVVEEVGDVCVLRLNDPAALNAASFAMVETLIMALDTAEDRSRAVMLTGMGRGFCSGANLGIDLDPEAPGYDAGASLDTHYNPLMRRLRRMQVPLVTAVNGPAAGIGAAIALAGDFILAAEHAYFLEAFCRIGLVPDGASAFLLLHGAGRARAMEAMLLGEKISATEARDWGLINRVTSAADLEQTALGFATRLAAGPTRALAMIRQLGWSAMDSDFSNMLDIERGLQREAGATADHREGIAAFLGKRPPRFRGQ